MSNDAQHFYFYRMFYSKLLKCMENTSLVLNKNQWLMFWLSHYIMSIIYHCSFFFSLLIIMSNITTFKASVVFLVLGVSILWRFASDLIIDGVDWYIYPCQYLQFQAKNVGVLERMLSSCCEVSIQLPEGCEDPVSIFGFSPFCKCELLVIGAPFAVSALSHLLFGHFCLAVYVHMEVMRQTGRIWLNWWSPTITRDGFWIRMKQNN